MKELGIFRYGETEVRTVEIEGEPWFVAADVCNILEIGNPSMALRSLDDDEKGLNTIETLGGRQEMTVINEPGLYSLILRSRKPEAKQFKRWITHDVLPALRKKGRYEIVAKPDLTPKFPDDPILATIESLATMRRDQLELAQRIATIETYLAADQGLVTRYLVRSNEKMRGCEDMEPQSCSFSEARARLGVDVETMENLCRTGNVEFFRRKGKRRIVSASLLRLMRS